MFSADAVALLRGLVGKPYRAGAEGPDAFDCYGLTRLVQREVFGQALPAGRALPDRRAWRRIAAPIEGAVLLMGAGAGAKHIGVYVGGGVLHALEGPGVVFDDFLSLPFRGFGHFRVYAPA